MCGFASYRWLLSALNFVILLQLVNVGETVAFASAFWRRSRFTQRRCDRWYWGGLYWALWEALLWGKLADRRELCKAFDSAVGQVFRFQIIFLVLRGLKTVDAELAAVLQLVRIIKDSRVSALFTVYVYKRRVLLLNGHHITDIVKLVIDVMMKLIQFSHIFAPTQAASLSVSKCLFLEFLSFYFGLLGVFTSISALALSLGDFSSVLIRLFFSAQFAANQVMLKLTNQLFYIIRRFTFDFLRRTICTQSSIVFIRRARSQFIKVSIAMKLKRLSARSSRENFRKSTTWFYFQTRLFSFSLLQLHSSSRRRIIRKYFRLFDFVGSFCFFLSMARWKQMNGIRMMQFPIRYRQQHNSNWVFQFLSLVQVT